MGLFLIFAYATSLNSPIQVEALQQHANLLLRNSYTLIYTWIPTGRLISSIATLPLEPQLPLVC